MLISQLVIQFPLAYVLSKHTALGASGLWWAFPVANVVIAFATFAVYTRGDWKKKRLTAEESVEEQVTEEIIAEEAFTSRQP